MRGALYAGNVCAATGITAIPAATGELTLVFDYKDDKNYYSLSLQPKSVSLSATINGTSRQLASAPVQVSAGSAVTLQRRPWSMQVVIDRHVVLTAYDATFTSGKVGSTGTGGWAVKDARLQPIEEVWINLKAELGFPGQIGWIPRKQRIPLESHAH